MTKNVDDNYDSKDLLTLLCKYRTPIMGFAAIWIFVSHVWLVVFYKIPYINKLEYFIAKIGFAGVDIFFLVSAIGLTHSISKHTLKEYFFGRIKRLLIPVFIVITIKRYYLSLITIGLYFQIIIL